jgi:hypothetical protein
MSEGFAIVQLQPGESLVFGPTLETSSSSFSIQGVNVGGSSKETRTGVTTRRVIREVSTGEIQELANGEIKKVTLAREKELGVDVMRLVSVTGADGRTIAVGVGGLDPSEEKRLRAIFPAAELVAKKKGWLSFLGL